MITLLKHNYKNAFSQIISAKILQRNLKFHNIGCVAQDIKKKFEHIN